MPVQKAGMQFRTPTDAAEFPKAPDMGIVLGHHHLQSLFAILMNIPGHHISTQAVALVLWRYNCTVHRSTHNWVENWCTVPSFHPIPTLPPVPSTNEKCLICNISFLMLRLNISRYHLAETKKNPSPFEETDGLLVYAAIIPSNFHSSISRWRTQRPIAYTCGNTSHGSKEYWHSLSVSSSTCLAVYNVKCLFDVLHDMVGKHFTLKEVFS